VACLTLQDWEDLTNKYKHSKKKSEKELYETLSESFLPEIVKMFAEKEKEEKRKLLLMQPKRASSRIERKKQEQEERERLLAEKMEEARKLEEDYDEKLKMEEDEIRAKDREERIKARDQAKELRSQRFMERELKSSYLKSRYDSDEEEKMVTRDPSYNPGRVQTNVKNESDPEEEEEEDDYEDDRDSGNERYSSSSRSRTNFTNALLRVGTKSTKDSSLDKPVRKGPGLLLEAAGRSLAQRAGGSTQSYKSGTGGSSILSGGSTIGGLSFGLASSKISFGLYRGDLPVDHASYIKPKSENTSPSNNDLGADKEENESRLGKASDNTRQKVFSNWGGEFFKKNLDYRANTNKILEKMNLTSKSNGDNSSNNSASGSSGNSSSWMKSASSGSTGSSKRPFEQDNSTNSPSKKLKSSFLNSYS